MARSLPVVALLLVAVAASSASAQHVVYSTPVVYQQPVYTYTQPVVYHQPTYTFARPTYSISNTAGMNAWQAGYLFNRPLFAGPASAHPISRPFWMSPHRDPDNYFGGSPFQNRPLLNIAIGLALR
jgi:hypothetical protein